MEEEEEKKRDKKTTVQLEGVEKVRVKEYVGEEGEVKEEKKRVKKEGEGEKVWRKKVGRRAGGSHSPSLSVSH